MRALLGCANAGEASAVRVRGAALEVLVGREGMTNWLLRAEEAPRGPSGGAAVMDTLNAAAEGVVEGLPAVLDPRLRERCAAEFDRLHLREPAQAGVPIRARPRYASLGLEARLAKLRTIWERRAERQAERPGGADAPDPHERLFGVGGPEPLNIPAPPVGGSRGQGAGAGLASDPGWGAASAAASSRPSAPACGATRRRACGATRRRRPRGGDARAPCPTRQVRVGTICEDLLTAVGKLDARRLARSRNMVRVRLAPPCR